MSSHAPSQAFDNDSGMDKRDAMHISISNHWRASSSDTFTTQRTCDIVASKTPKARSYLSHVGQKPERETVHDSSQR